jgi:hypothetical protein
MVFMLRCNRARWRKRSSAPTTNNLVLWVGAAAFLGACSDGARVISPPESSSVGGEGNEPASDTVERGPLYLVGDTVYSPDQATTYLSVVPSLDDNVKLDHSRSLEIAGPAVPYGIPGSGKVYVSSQESGTMTEVLLGADDSLSLGRVVSFQNLGISDTWGLNVILSPTKAYFISQSTFDVVVWNPEEMTMSGSFPTGLGLEGANDSRVFIRDPIFVGDKLVLVSGQWADYIPDRTTSLTVIDTTNDSVLSNTTEARCYSLLAFATAGDGNRYFISNGLGATGHLTVPELVPAPCMIRMKAGETTFDPDWSRSLTADLATSLWTGIAPGSDGKLLIQAISEDAPQVVAAADALEMANVSGWTWYQMDDADAVPTAIDSTLASAQNTTVMMVDGRAYMTAEGSADSTLVQTTFAGQPSAGLITPGYIWNVLRVR